MNRNRTLLAATAAVVLVGLIAVWLRAKGASVAPVAVAANERSVVPTRAALLVEPEASITSGESRIEVDSKALTSGPIDIRGRVVDEAGDGIERFAVEATRLNERNFVVDERKLPLGSRANGEFDLMALEAGRWAVEPRVDGMQGDDGLQFEKSTDGRVEFVMHRVGVARVLVFDSKHQPVPDAIVSIDGRAHDVRVIAPSVFELKLDPNDYQVSASAPGFRDSGGQLLHVGTRYRVSDVEFILHRSAALRGKLSHHSGQPAANWRVSCSWDNDPVATTDAAGQFELTELEARRVQVFLRDSSGDATANPCFITDVELHEGEITEVDLRLARARSVRVIGHLTMREPLETGGLAFTPCDGQVSMAAQFGTQAYPDGAFSLTLPTLGRFRIEAIGTMRGGQPVKLNAGTIDVPDQDVFEVNLNL